MCGIIGYVGEKEANDILIAGLEKLEYRGYDSAGIAIVNNNQIQINKAEGRASKLKNKKLPGTMGIGHTRWSTHGKPSDRNAHPFIDNTNNFVIVHNGIIENYLELKAGLEENGVIFTSDTDSEVIVHLIAKAYAESPRKSLKDAVLKVVSYLQGSYALCVLHRNSGEIIGARNGSPLLVGLGNNENFLASDASAIIEHTKQVIYLEDFEVAEVKKDSVQVYAFTGEE
ncbi:MAG: class II glutamine amidotransferase, partial [Nanoarchaeota archaeon]